MNKRINISDPPRWVAPVIKGSPPSTRFRVLGVEKHEIRHSNVLAWLLSPYETHGLGKWFLVSFLKLLSADGGVQYKDCKRSVSNCIVYREWQNIDILLVSEEGKWLVAIENKIRAKESFRKENGKSISQLVDYQRTLENVFPSFKRCYVFLTVSGENPSEEQWVPVSFHDIVNILDSTCQHKLKKNGEMNGFIRQYSKLLKETIMDRSDDECKEKCRRLYKKYRNEIELILKCVKESDDAAIDSILKKLEKEGQLVRCTEKGIPFFSFHTKLLDNLLPELASESGSWGTKSVYYCWMQVDTEQQRVRCVFELGANNCPAETKSRMVQVLEKTSTKKTPTRWNRVKWDGKRPHWFHYWAGKDSRLPFEKAINDAIQYFLKRQKDLSNLIQS